MKTILWRDRIKVVTGEITRPQQMYLQRDIANMKVMLDEMTNDDALMYLDNVLALRATRAIYVCEGGEWLRVEQPVTIEVAGEAFEFEPPSTMTSGQFSALPSSLTSEWLDAVAAENDYVINRFLSFMKAPPTTLNSSAPASDTEASVAPSSKPRRKTKTTGR